MGVSKVKGTFPDYDITLHAGKARDLSQASVTAVIRMASVHTSKPDWDTKLRSPDWFDTAQYPEIRFRSRSVRTAGDHWEATGPITLHGVTRDASCRSPSRAASRIRARIRPQRPCLGRAGPPPVRHGLEEQQRGEGRRQQGDRRHLSLGQPRREFPRPAKAPVGLVDKAEPRQETAATSSGDKTRSVRALAVALLATWLLAADTTAQTLSPTGNLYGTALDTQGTSVVGVTATLTGPGAAQVANTDANGDFRFLNLSPGRLLRYARGDRARDGAMRVTVASGKSAVLSITMPVAGVAEAVTVSGDAALDSRKIQTGATFGQKELESIPTTRDPWAILRQVPGVLFAGMNVGGGAARPGPSSSARARIRIKTATSSTASRSAWAASRRSSSTSTRSHNIEVTTGGSDPSLATPGVTLNLVTKRGTNDLLGSARALYTGGVGWDYGIEAGGPLWKDRLWLWGAGARNAFLG